MKEIIEIASKFIKEENQQSSLGSDYYYGLDEQPIDFIDRWYFDYIIHCKKNISQEKQEIWCGAPGYTIDKNTKELNVISIHKLHYLKNTKKQKEILEHHLHPDNKEIVSLKSLKEITKLKANDLVEIKEKVLSENMSDEKNRKQVIGEIIQLMYK